VSRDLFLLIRLLVLNFSPAIKRLFWWQPEIYGALSLAALLATCNLAINLYKLSIVILLAVWLLVSIEFERAINLYFPMLIVWLFSSTLPYHNVRSVFWRMRYVFLAAVLYGAYQKSFGFLSHELSWIYSGMGAVREEGYFVTDEIRPFSFFAGIPEFGFFSAIMLYFALEKKSPLYGMIALTGLYLSGTRGVILSTIIAFIVLFFHRRISHRTLIVLGVVLAILAYVLLAIVLPTTGLLEAKSDNSRLLVYGTFGYRVTMLMEFWSEVNWSNIWFGVGVERNLFDNMFVSIVNDLGIFPLILLLIWIFRAAKERCGLFISVLVFSYCLYADALFSVYFAFNAFLMLNSRSAGSMKRLELEPNFICFPKERMV